AERPSAVPERSGTGRIAVAGPRNSPAIVPTVRFARPSRLASGRLSTPSPPSAAYVATAASVVAIGPVAANFLGTHPKACRSAVPRVCVPGSVGRAVAPADRFSGSLGAAAPTPLQSAPASPTTPSPAAPPA